ncbi:MAG: GrpE protein [Bacillales bacterium]|nr:GrpE protein [Bacillales bacterium]
MSEVKDNQKQEEVVEEISEQSVQDIEEVEEVEDGVIDPIIDPAVDFNQKLKEAEDKHLRLYADFENYRRRVRLDTEAAQKYRAQEIIMALLPAMDNFERAMKVEATTDEAKTLMQGMEMVYNQIQTALKNEGCEVIESVGKPFDPNFHQAIMQVEVEGYNSNDIVEEFQKGYMLKDRVIRPAMVTVQQ